MADTTPPGHEAQDRGAQVREGPPRPCSKCEWSCCPCSTHDAWFDELLRRAKETPNERTESHVEIHADANPADCPVTTGVTNEE